MTHVLPAKQVFIPSRFKNTLEAVEAINETIAQIEDLEARLSLMVASTDHLFSNRLDVNDRYVIGRSKRGKLVLGRKIA